MKIDNPHPKYLNLGIGDIYFGDDQAGVKTLLGSCIAVTLWHPLKKLGGMCHIMMPGEPGDTDTKYATAAIAYFVREIKKAKTHPYEYDVRVFGGGKMIMQETPHSMQDIGNRNAWKTLELLAQHGFRLQDMDLIDSMHRSVSLNLSDGTILLKKG